MILFITKLIFIIYKIVLERKPVTMLVATKAIYADERVTLVPTTRN